MKENIQADIFKILDEKIDNTYEAAFDYMISIKDKYL